MNPEITNRIEKLELELSQFKDSYYKDNFAGSQSFSKPITLQSGLIQSGNFKTAVSGWRIDASGDIETNGTITASRLTLNNFFNDDDSSIAYTGTWAQVPVGVLLGGTRTQSTTINDFFVISFTGSSIGIIVSKASDSGKLEVYIDDVLQETVDLYSTTLFTRSIVYSTNTLSAGEHTLKGKIVAKNPLSIAEGMGLQGYTLFPHDGIKMEQLSAELFVYSVNLLTNGNGYVATAISMPAGYSVYHVVGMVTTVALMENTATSPILAWRTTEIYLYYGAANTTYPVQVTLLLSKI